jgi:L-asparagine oxygenase
VRNKDLLTALGDETCDALRLPEFYTPFDDLTTYKSAVPLGKADVHPILGGATPTDIRFFENRTEGLTTTASAAVARLIEVLHRLKKRVLIQPGDLLGSANNDCLHNKDVGIIRDEKALKERWLMKTVNVRSLNAHHAHLAEGRPRIVNG